MDEEQPGYSQDFVKEFTSSFLGMNLGHKYSGARLFSDFKAITARSNNSWCLNPFIEVFHINSQN